MINEFDIIKGQLKEDWDINKILADAVTTKLYNRINISSIYDGKAELMSRNNDETKNIKRRVAAVGMCFGLLIKIQNTVLKRPAILKQSG